MQNYKLSLKDINANYFHFTRKSNLKSIENKGLLPKISFHAMSLEDTKKVFFVSGLDNLLILFDCWIHVCSKYPLIPGLFSLGTKIMRYKWFPKPIINAYFKYTEYNRLHKFVAYKYFDYFLKNYCLLNLNIEEKLDFDFEDIDQIKAKNYPKDYLIKGGYSPKYTDLESIKMDKWNLHTFTNHGIESKKLKLCYINEFYKMKDILDFALKNTNLNIEDICPVLWQYLKNRKYI
ncbi:MAG: hypothetical protein HFI87_06875 [Bacilli bacterium]|nr:hypothetical protein [Bacilli bacterium]